ncbi:hypothetical protein WICPIJ_001021 [Wickerhamomyces pijperi]|uniref:SPX domain-containing protein n=1 Tax=Wickerhamomyces pijperi TaxID=599730 RepID=A0A9P8QEQ3_WICPI|nr:hypothetical protein WICPIJ_001021 [Wickerhamomyces pijperi]
MKFSHSLQFNAVPEWSSKYIAYSNLKKLIYNLQRESLETNSNKNRNDSESSYLISQQHETREVNAVFLKALNTELKKVDSFYQEREKFVYQDFAVLVHDLNRLEKEIAASESGVQIPKSTFRRAKSYPTNMIQDHVNSSGNESGADDDEDIEDFTSDVPLYDGPGTNYHRHRSSSFSQAQRDLANSTLHPTTTPEVWDITFDDSNDPYGVLSDKIITLKRRIVALFTTLSELKSFIELNRTGFTKALKKYDKSLDTKLKDEYLANLNDNVYTFKEATEAELKKKIDQMVVVYAHIATSDSLDHAKSELRLHLREHVVWERNTVWRDMIGLERKAQYATVARNKNSKEVMVGEEDERRSSDSLFTGNTFTLILTITVTALLLQVSPFQEVEQKNCFALLVCASILWATEAIPLFVTSLLVPLLIVTLGVLKDDKGNRMDPESASKFILGSMWGSVIMLLLGGFTLAAALSKYNIAKVVSTWILSKAGTSPKIILLTIMIVALVVSMWVSNVAAPVLCYSIIQSLLRTLPRGSTFAKQLVLGIALASNIGGMASPIASPQNIISIGMMDPQPSWGQWFLVALPVSFISLISVWAFLLVTFSSRENVQIAAIRTVNDKFTKQQWFITIVTLFTIALWCLAHQLQDLFGEMGIISIIPMILFFGTGILTGEDFNNFLWTIVQLAMGGIALGKAVSSSGLLAVIAKQIQEQVQGYSLFSVMIIFGALILVMATFVSHTVAALIIVPLVAEIGNSMEDPHANLLIMISAFLCSCAMGLPTSGFPNVTAISLTDDFGDRYLTVGNFISRGVPASIFAYTVVVTVGYVLIRFIGF